MIAQFLIKQEIIETNEMVKLTGLLAVLNI